MRVDTRILAGVVVVCAAAAAALAGPIDDAMAAYKKGDYAKAAEIAAKVPAAAKDKPKALYVQGEAELAQEHWDAAEAAFRKVLEKSPDAVPAMTGVGRALTGNGSLDEGGKILGRAVQVDNRDVRAWQAQCANFIARGTKEYFEGAKTNLDATLKLDAKDPVTNQMMVDVLLRLADLDGAERAADTYLKCDKDAAMAWFLRGLVHDRRGSADKAADAYEKSLKRDGEFIDAHKNLAILLTSTNKDYADAAKLKSALAHAQRYVELGGKDKEFIALFEKIRTGTGSPPAGPAKGK